MNSMSNSYAINIPITNATVVSPKKSDPWCQCFTGCLSAICGLSVIGGILGSAIYFIYYGIKMLWENKDMADFNPCPNSHLWQATLTSFVLLVSSILSGLQNYSKKEDEDKSALTIYCSVCCLITINTGIVIWEYVELFVIPFYDYTNSTNITITNTEYLTNATTNLTNASYLLIETPCQDLTGTNIWAFELFQAGIRTFAVGISVIGIFITGCVVCIVNNKK
jgi:hypothetical protein